LLLTILHAQRCASKQVSTIMYNSIDIESDTETDTHTNTLVYRAVSTMQASIPIRCIYLDT
jgi:hypothetical protein